MTRLLALTALLLLLQAAWPEPAQAERHVYGWRENHYGSRRNYRPERYHPLPRAGHALRYRPRLGPPL